MAPQNAHLALRIALHELAGPPALLSDAFSPITYDGEKPADLLAEDKVIGARKLEIKPEAVTITKVEDVFAR